MTLIKKQCLCRIMKDKVYQAKMKRKRTPGNFFFLKYLDNGMLKWTGRDDERYILRN